MEGLIGEQDDSASLTDGNLAKEPPASSNDAAESSGDTRLGIGGNATKKLSAKTRIISKTQGREGAIYLAVLLAEREKREREKREVVLVVLVVRLLHCSSSSSSSSNSI